MTGKRSLCLQMHAVTLFNQQSESGRFRFLVPPTGTTCLSTSHLRRHSRFSNND